MVVLLYRGTRYILRRYGTEYEWTHEGNPEDGFGPFLSKREALAFAKRVGTVTSVPR